MIKNITQEDFGTLAICAIRYCHGRQTYMPGLVQSIANAINQSFDVRFVDEQEGE